MCIDNNCGEVKKCVSLNCGCQALISSDCVNEVTETLVCSNIIKGQTLTEVLVQLDAYICDRFLSFENFIKLVNIGDGVGIYRGDNLLGKKELKSLKNSGLIDIIESGDTITSGGLTVGRKYQIDVLNAGDDFSNVGFVTLGVPFTATGITPTVWTNATVVQRTDVTITIAVNEAAMNTFIEANQKTTTVENVGLGDTLVKAPVVVGDNTEYDIKTLKLSSVGAGAEVVKEIDSITSADELDFKLKTLKLSSVGGGAELIKEIDSTTSVDELNFKLKSIDATSVGTGESIIKEIDILTNPDKVDIKHKSLKSTNNSIVVTGSTEEINIETNNLQKVITYPTDFTLGVYTLSNDDNKYTIFIDNGANAVSIDVPTGLSANFEAGFIQKGTADVTFTATGTTVNNPIGLKSKGQFYQTFIEKELATEVYYLLGNTKI